MDRDSVAASALVLADFVPFRLNRLADAVSRNLSEIYRRRFGLEIPEWRVLVTVGQRGYCTAQEIAASTRMHKTRVSRAVSGLEARKLVAREPSGDDARAWRLHLTGAGRRVYDELVPLALERERSLLACLEGNRQQRFLSALAALEQSLGLTADE